MIRFIPMCAFLSTLVWGLGKARPHMVKIVSGSFLGVAIFGIILDFQHPKFIDYQFPNEIKKFETLEKGEKVIIQINPPQWTMELTKR